MGEKRIGRQTPTQSVVLPYSQTAGLEAVDLYNRSERKAMEWQSILICDIMAINGDGLWVHTKFGYSVPRRNGKSEMGNLKSKAFWDAAFVRAIRTLCQTALGCIGGATILGGVDWKFTVSATLLSGIMSILTSVATNLPEVEDYDGIHQDKD